VVWIMSQRILIHLRGMLPSFSGCHQSPEFNSEVAAESNKLADSIALTRNHQSSKDVVKAVRSQSDSKTTNADVELAVQVHVERSVEYDCPDYDKDSRKLNVAWDFRS
jgi:hypothetical protein